MNLHRWFVFSTLVAGVAQGQLPEASRVAHGTTVSGIVRDSLARAPLAGAMVELVAADNPSRFARTTVTDAQGHYMLTDVPDGHHMLGFFHPLLDSIGVDAPLRDVFVSESHPVYADLAVPSARRIRTAICGSEIVADSGAVIVGIVRDARDGAPIKDALVSGEWMEVSLRRDGMISRQMPKRVVTTAENGWFALCNVPNGGTISLVASRGADSTDIVEVRAPADGLLRHEIFIGSATKEARDGVSDNAGSSLKRVRTGDGRISGSVVALSNGVPLVGALVSIRNGPETHTDEAGQWSISGAPTGTRTIDVRALGYIPTRRRVDIIPGAQPIEVGLSTLQSVLDTVRVMASRLNQRDGDGFEKRKKSGIGKYVTTSEMAKWKVVNLSDIFRQIPGLTLDTDTTGIDKHILMRGAFGKCAPAVFINGLVMTGRTPDGGDAISITADDLDTWIRPGDVTGIEVYSGDTVPPEFQQGMSGCGSLLIWTRLGRV